MTHLPDFPTRWTALAAAAVLWSLAGCASLEAEVLDRVRGEAPPGGVAQDGVPGDHAGGGFEPGARVLFASDFSRDRLGQFPSQLEYVRGSWEVMDVGGRRFLASTGSSSGFRVPLAGPLPERFTVEADVHYTGRSGGRIQSGIGFGAADGMYDFRGHWVSFNGSFVEVRHPDADDPVASEETTLLAERVVPIQIAVEGSTLQVFVAGQRIANVPNAEVDRSGVVEFRLTGGASTPAYIGDVRIAAF